MLKRIQPELDGNGERGFTMIEFLVVTIIIGILLAIAIPSYIGFRDRAANNAAKESLRSALPTAELYYEDTGTYVGMSASSLAELDDTVSSTLTVAVATSDSYCLTDTVNGKTWSVRGPDPSGADFKSNANCK